MKKRGERESLLALWGYVWWAQGKRVKRLKLVEKLKKGEGKT